MGRAIHDFGVGVGVGDGVGVGVGVGVGLDLGLHLGLGLEKKLTWDSRRFNGILKPSIFCGHSDTV